MPIVVTAQDTIQIGAAEPIQGNAPEGSYAAVFEDDGDTAYFYALDFANAEQPIQNALHIYNVADVSDKHLPSEVTMGWSTDGSKVVLLINGYPHAVFDFAAKHGYCRTAFPPPDADSGWSGHDWSDDAVELFATES
ncbi:DUF2251 domain-containing protein [Comamonas sp.]|uniref:DUF2251 domain-containing protein n=1 Tax=Comamonas sp. TaxID=34028 RepID=UPI0028975F87|nr:DUF2251 domain-containing protein [Comamonas sp.]